MYGMQNIFMLKLMAVINDLYPEQSEVEVIIEAGILEYILMQYSLNKGLKIYGEKGEHATKKELKQQTDMSMFEPINSNNLTVEEKLKEICIPCVFNREKRWVHKGACMCRWPETMQIH